MNLWKLEWLRLLRTRRLLVLFAVFIIFGFIGPLLAKYLPDLISNSAGSDTGGLSITVTRAPIAADGFAQYMSSVLQMGLIVVVIVAAKSLAIDAKRSLSTFYRTRITKTTDLLLPRFTVVTIATLCAFVAGTLTAWYESAALLGHVNAHAVLVGSLYIGLYWVFSVAAVALAASLVRSVLGAVGIALGILFLSPVLSTVKNVGQWLPTSLSGSMDALFSGQHAASYYYRAAAVTVVAIALFLSIAVRRLKSRELDS